ncbi:MAG: hypothetical protein ACRERU_00085 [Methylococcales bacterium]
MGKIKKRPAFLPFFGWNLELVPPIPPNSFSPGAVDQNRDFVCHKLIDKATRISAGSAISINLENAFRYQPTQENCYETTIAGVTFV